MTKTKRNAISTADKAKAMRYRRAALALIQWERLENELCAIVDDCYGLEWSIGDDDALLDVFDGDTDEISEFRFAFSDLSAKCETLNNAIYDNGVTKHFDDFFVGALGDAYQMVGYDAVEEDYYSLTRFEAGLAQGVSGKRLMGLTKEKLIAVTGQCLGVMMCFLDIRHQYDCLKAVFDLLRDERAELMANVRMMEAAYEKTQADPYDYAAMDAYDSLLGRLPDRVWVE